MTSEPKDFRGEGATAAPLLEMEDISKSFPGVRALDGVSFDLRRGEVHALVGENGAGKSTLMKILGGVHAYPSYDGTVSIDGVPRRLRNVHDAEASGVAVVFQELSLVKEMTVGENIFLGREPRRMGFVAWTELYRRAAEALAELEIDLDPYTTVDRLGIGQQQLVEIAKALSHDARILVLDEPTAALTGTEVEVLFRVLDRLRGRGVGIVYISHKLDEVFRVSDRITVLRDGRSITTRSKDDLSDADVIRLMVGREVTELFPEREHEPGDIVFRARGITVEDPDVPGKRLVDSVDLEVRRGEVLGIGGLMGAGRSDLLMALFGAHPGWRAGEIEIDGRAVRVRSPRDAIRAGIALVTEDRKRFGLVLDQSVVENMTLASLRRLANRPFTNRNAEERAVTASVGELRIKVPSPFAAVGTLSGGNQQKVVIGKWLLTEPKVLLLDEPTRGIDIGARQEIYGLVERLAQSGLAIVMVSSELPELLGLSDRVLVLHEGRATGRLDREQATPEAVMAFATGGSA